MFDFNVKIFGNMSVTVVAENEKEAERILNDTIESITIKDIREKMSRSNEVEIKNSNVITDINEKSKIEVLKDNELY